MPRKRRVDYPGAWHHVYNRGIAQRPIFETEADFRYFKSRLACAVRRREIEVHSYSLLINHFHLLARSLGRLSIAMNRIENEYVRWFNRRRRRDGSLFRGRFGSKLVETHTYRCVLVQYIDRNPVEAGLSDTPEGHRHGSAFDFLTGRRPPWLSVAWLDEELQSAPSGGADWRNAYRGRFHDDSMTTGFLVERRMRFRSEAPDPLGHLLAASPAKVRAWFEERAQLADRTTCKPVADPASVNTILKHAERAHGTWTIYVGSRPANAWQLVRIALLRELCGLTVAEIAARSHLTISKVGRLRSRHAAALLEPRYAERLSQLAARVMAKCHEKWSTGGSLR